MKSFFKPLFLVITLSFFLSVPSYSYAQFQSNNENEQETESISNSEDLESISLTVDNSIGKKKKKKKDEIKMDTVFFINIGINIASLLILLLLVYYPHYKKFDYIFTFSLFNIVIFLLTYVLNDVKISMGAAFGLFAVFSMLRYRTAGISIKDMTYLFIFIGLGLIAAVRLPYYTLLVIHGIIITSVFVLECDYLFPKELSKSINYEKIELIKPQNYDLLIEDLKNRTGLNIKRVVVGKIDFMKDTANVKIYYYA